MAGTYPADWLSALGAGREKHQPLQPACGRHNKLRVCAERLAQNQQETALMKAIAPFTYAGPNHEITRASQREIDVNYRKSGRELGTPRGDRRA
jgi:hypothetical protein